MKKLIITILGVFCTSLIFGQHLYSTYNVNPFEIQKGNIEGTSLWTMFGERIGFETTVTGEDLWSGEATRIPVPSDEGVQMAVVSTSSNDDSGGTGVQKVVIEYLDTEGDSHLDTVTMNGTSGVNINPSTVRFVNDFYAINVGSNGVAVGDVKLYLSGTVTTVYSIIKSGGNQSMVCQKMVPNNHTLYLTNWYVSEGDDKELRFRIRSTDKNGIIVPGIFLFKDVTYVKKTSSPTMIVQAVIPELSIVKITGWAVVASSDGTATAHGILVAD